MRKTISKVNRLVKITIDCPGCQAEKAIQVKFQFWSFRHQVDVDSCQCPGCAYDLTVQDLDPFLEKWFE